MLQFPLLPPIRSNVRVGRRQFDRWTALQPSTRHFHCVDARQEPVEFPFDDRITFACPFLESGPVDDLDPATAMMDQIGFAKLAGGLGYAFAAHAEHIRYKLLGNLQIACT